MATHWNDRAKNSDEILRQLRARDGFVDFARLKLAGNTQQTKNCTKGWPCGFTCLSRAKKNCKRQLEGQSKDLQGWLEKNDQVGSIENQITAGKFKSNFSEVWEFLKANGTRLGTGLHYRVQLGEKTYTVKEVDSKWRASEAVAPKKQVITKIFKTGEESVL